MLKPTLIPLSVQHAPQDGRACLLGDRLQGIQRCLGVQGHHVRRRQIEAGQVAHAVRGALVSLADQHADVAQRASPSDMRGDVSRCYHGYQRPDRAEGNTRANLSRSLCALTPIG